MTKKQRTQLANVRKKGQTKALQRTGGEVLGAVVAAQTGLLARNIGPVPVALLAGAGGAFLEYKRGGSAGTATQVGIGALKVMLPLLAYQRAAAMKGNTVGGNILGSILGGGNGQG